MTRPITDPAFTSPGKFVDEGQPGGTGFVPNSCQTCRWKHWGKTTCDAFPEDPPGRPIEIVLGEHDHTTPWPGDQGFRYQPGPIEPPP